jgi:hypothetical protein
LVSTRCLIGTLGSIAAFNDPSCIGPLLELFEDEPPSDDLLFSVVHAIEAYPDHVYVAGLLGATEALLARTPRWARILYMRVLNAPTARTELASAIRHEPEPTRVTMSLILEDIERRRPEFTSKTAEVRRNL